MLQSTLRDERVAISVPAPTQRFNQTQAALTSAQQKHAGRLQQKLTR